MVECLAGKLVRCFVRFTIRDVLWLTVVVAMAMGWYCDRANQKAERITESRIQGGLLRSAQTEAARARGSEAAIRSKTATNED